MPAAAAPVGPGEAITFAPAMLTVDARAGSTQPATIVVKNQTRSDAAFSVEVLDAQAGPPPSYSLEYVAIGEARSGRGAGAWITLRGSRSFLVAAGTERTIALDVVVPEGTAPGGYYGALSFDIREPRSDRQVELQLRQPVPVLLRVGTGMRRDLQVKVVAPDRLQWRGARQRWTVEIHNRGVVHEVIDGRITVRGVLAGAQSEPLRPGILLPGERRRQRVAFDLRDAPDRYDARARVVREAGLKPRGAAARPVFVVPWWLVVIVALTVAVVAWRIRRIRSA